MGVVIPQRFRGATIKIVTPGELEKYPIKYVNKLIRILHVFVLPNPPIKHRES